jgi:hypothetical protein
MITEDVIDFSRDFHAEIHAEAHALEALREEIFVQKMGDILEDYGEIETLVPSPYQNPGMKVDGYCYDDEFKDLTLVISHYLDESGVDQAKVSNTDISREFKRGITFFERCLKGLYNKIEISRECYDLAKLIYECKKEIRNVRLVLLTDGVTQKRSAEIEEINGIEISRTIWDIERVSHFHRTGEREKIAVDFSKYCNGPLPCVIQENGDSRYTTYLGFIPGSALADMYALWGIKMLDMNVRVFLSARGNVNKGIRKTIIDEPEMFCTYNNGITVFARNVKTVLTSSGVGLLGADDFQIINGGQTTASLYHTRKKDKADLSKTSVQMKLTVIHDENDVPELIPKISRFSNTQNKVQLADLAANESPHPEIQAVSNSILAPDPTGGSQQTYWFYERSRGSYEEFRNLQAKTPAQKKHFDFMRPKKQKFDKLQFGKAWHAYLRLPHLVSLGGQKNFGRFNDWLKDQKEEDWVSFFRKTVALLIVWNETERLVRRQKFEGYYHNIVAYSLAWLFHLTDFRIDLEKVWQKQTTGEALLALMEKMTHIVNTHIRNTDLNVTEYCKKEECWNKLKTLHCTIPTEIQAEYITEESRAVYRPGISSDAEALEFCKERGSQAWMDLASWLKQRDFLTPKARSQCFNMGRSLRRGKDPSIVLSVACKKAWQDAEIRGWDCSNNRGVLDDDII